MWSIPPSDIAVLLREDVPAGDLTTASLGIGDRSAQMTFRARGPMTIAGIEIAADMARQCGLETDLLSGSGEHAAAGDVLLVARGTAGAVHRAWKASQTLVEILSGVATAARRMVDAVEAVNPSVRVACTRKTFPGGRRLSQIAVTAGGAILHRAGLSETVLVFPEHRAFLADTSLAELAATLRARSPEKKIVVEMASVADACAATDAGFDVVQLEKLGAEEVAVVAAHARAAHTPPLIAVAGGVNATNAADYVRAGAGLVVSSWPYTARPSDVAVTIVPYVP